MKSKSYRPSNGTEGMIFHDKFCEKCKKYRNGLCSIFNKSLTYSIDEKGYPKEWVYDLNNKPTCTSFTDEIVKRKKHFNENEISLFEDKG